MASPHSARDDELMDPKASPRRVKTGVRRLNSRPLWILLVVVIAFLAVMAKTAIDRSEQQRLRARANESSGGDSSLYAQNIAGRHLGDYIPADPDPPPVVPISKEELDLPPPPPASTNSPPSRQETTRDNESERIRAMKVSAMLAAVSAPTISKATNDNAPAAKSGAREHAPLPPYLPGSLANAPPQLPRSNVAQRERAIASGHMTGDMDQNFMALPSESAEPGFESRANVEQWDNTRPGQDRWRLRSKLQSPRSDYEMRAGTVIPALLITAINSDLGGPITAQVSENVYDTATGRELLIPQGTKLVGRYSNEVAFGQSRVLVGWQRLTFPDGRALDIGSMPGAAGDGTAGFGDKVNHHYFRIIGNAVLLSAISGGIALSQNRRSTNAFQAPSASDVMSQQLGIVLGQTLAQVIRKNLNISPTIEIRPGFRFNVIATKDVTLDAPYQAFAHKRTESP